MRGQASYGVGCDPSPSRSLLRQLCSNEEIDLFGSQIQGDLIGAVQWRIYQGAAKEFAAATSDNSP